MIDMALLQFVFSDNIQRFYAHKSLSKFYVSFAKFDYAERCC